MGIFDKFKIGFKKSASAFTSGLRDIIVKKEIDDKTLDQIEEYLIQSDVLRRGALRMMEFQLSHRRTCEPSPCTPKVYLA